MVGSSELLLWLELEFGCESCLYRILDVETCRTVSLTTSVVMAACWFEYVSVHPRDEASLLHSPNSSLSSLATRACQTVTVLLVPQQRLARPRHSLAKTVIVEDPWLLACNPWHFRATSARQRQSLCKSEAPQYEKANGLYPQS